MRARVLIVAGLVLLASRAGAEPAGERLAVVVHPSRSVALAVDEVAEIYLKKRRFWDRGGDIVALNREASSPIRAAFTRAVFGGEARWLAVYWNRQYFLGVLPPATLASDEAVKRFVASEPRAIGYVDATAVDDTVRVVLYLD